MTRVLMIDNYDSFVYNLVDEFKKRGCDVEVYRNDVGMGIIHQAVLRIDPNLLVLSPGPSAPHEAGDLEQIIRTYHRGIPILGVCLGHQAVGEVFGGRIARVTDVLHGKTSPVYHNGKGLYNELENPFNAGRYHSLEVRDMPDCLEETAYSFARDGQRIVMGFRHKEYPIQGVQFHPESILTVPYGSKIIDNMLKMV